MIRWFLGPEGMGDFNQWALVFLNLPTSLEALLAALLVLVLILLSLKNLKRLPGGWIKATLFSLRILFLAGLLLLWLAPAVQLRKVVHKKSHVWVLVDQSRSMGLGAGTGSPTRYGMVREFFEKNSDWLKELSLRHHLHFSGFDGGIRSLSQEQLKKTDPPTGDYTAIGAAIQGVQEGFRSQEIAGILLFSDGVSNPPATPQPDTKQLLEGMKTEGVAVIAFGAGGTEKVRDLAVRDVRYDGFAFVHNKMTIEVDISSRGYPLRDVQVNLETGGRNVVSKQLSVPSGGQASIVFSFTPNKVGRFVYTVGVPLSPDDAISENNSRSFIVDVIRDKIRVLHVCGHPSFDQQFLRRFLKNNPNVDLISFFILRTNSDLQLIPENELSLIPFPTEELFSRQLHTFDLLVFQDFTYRGYQMKQYLPNIRRYVIDGGAFLVVGGDLSFGPGGYDGTEVERILPFQIDGGAEADTAAFKMRVTEEGLHHPIMQILREPEANAELWKQVPELRGVNLGLEPYFDTLVLARHPKLQRSGKGAPVIGVRQVGKGRVMALGVDSTWRWHMDDVAGGGTGELYRAFYSNAVRWLIKDPELKHLNIRTDRPVAAPGENIRLNLHLTDENFQPRSNARLKISTYAPGSETPLHTAEVMTDEEGLADHSFKAPVAEGMLRLVVESEGSHSPAQVGAVQAGGVDDMDELLVFVTSRSGEYDEVSVDFDHLADIAEKSGGRFYTLPKTMGDEKPFNRTTSARIGKKRDIPIWDNAYVLFLLTALIALEWWWRKRRRLN